MPPPPMQPRCVGASQSDSSVTTGSTKPSCGRSVARIPAAERREGQDLHPRGPVRSEPAGGLPPSLRIANWGGGSSLAGAALFFQRGSADPTLSEKRSALLLPIPLGGTVALVERRAGNVALAEARAWRERPSAGALSDDEASSANASARREVSGASVPRS